MRFGKAVLQLYGWVSLLVLVAKAIAAYFAFTMADDQLKPLFLAWSRTSMWEGAVLTLGIVSLVFPRVKDALDTVTTAVPNFIDALANALSKQVRGTEVQEINPNHLSQLPNQHLKRVATELALQLRNFEAGYYCTEILISTDEQSKASCTTWRTDTETLEAVDAALAMEFNTRFLSDALALREEILRRLGQPPLALYDFSSPYFCEALDLGALDGPHPIAEAASKLERLAGQLPSCP